MEQRQSTSNTEITDNKGAQLWPKFLFICSKLYENPWKMKENTADNKFMDTKMNSRTINTANSKPTNSEDSLYVL
jgi:hypothetical protein